MSQGRVTTSSCGDEECWLIGWAEGEKLINILKILDFTNIHLLCHFYRGPITFAKNSGHPQHSEFIHNEDLVI